MKKDTQCVHSGTYVDSQTGGINTPIFTSSSFGYLDVPENIYPRYFNTPNQKTIIDKLCALENAEDGLVFSSGMAECTTTGFFVFFEHPVAIKKIQSVTKDICTIRFIVSPQLGI